MIQDWWQTTFPEGRKSLLIKDANGVPVSIAYGEAGQGPPLMLLHGLGSWSYNWRYNVKPLAQHFRVICIDAKGYGFSETSRGAEVVGHQVIELTRIVQQLSDQPVVLVGESMGGLTALALTQAKPHWIDRLVLMNVPIFPQQLPSWGMRWLASLPLDWAQWVDEAQILRWFAPLVQEMTRSVRQEVVVDPALITDDELYWLTYPYLYRSGSLTQFVADLQLAAHELQQLQQGNPNLIQTIQQKLPQITCPVLVLWSDQDQWFPVENGHQLCRHLVNSQFQVIPNCGHVASSSQPDTVNAAILAFMGVQERTP